MGIDVNELHRMASEYCDYKDRSDSDDPDDALTEDEQEEYNDLVTLNKELNDLLYYPSRIHGMTLVVDDKEGLSEYGRQWASDMGVDMDTLPDAIRSWVTIDWEGLGRDLMSEFDTFSWDGDDYFYNI